jgi:hypothetical protein
MRFRLGAIATGMVVACLGSPLLAHHSLWLNTAWVHRSSQWGTRSAWTSGLRKTVL